jgi:hypothetical protein
LICGFEVTDESRPCWPELEAGGRDPEGLYCNYADWWSEGNGIEDVDNETIVRFPLTKATWHGDHFTFTLGVPL